MSRIRNFVFTLNNWTKEEQDSLRSGKWWSYIVWGREVGEEGTHHLQGYAEMDKACEFTKIRKLIPRAHLESRRGTNLQAIEYCQKEGNWEEHGEKKSSGGSRTDVQKAYAAAKEGLTLEKFIDEEPGFQALRIFEIARVARQPDRKFKPEVIWIWGKTGAGKTRYVMDKESDIWKSSGDLKWWCGYENQEAVLLDEFRPHKISWDRLLTILDRYPERVEVKGGSRKLNSKRMYITANVGPEEMYKYRIEEDIKQLLRRIDRIIEM